MRLVHEDTLVFLLKPDAVIRRYVGARVLKEVLELNPKLKLYKQMRLTRRFLAEVHYVEHRTGDFFSFLLDYMSVNRVAAIILEGENSTRRVRELLGPTRPEEAAIRSPTSLRARYGIFGGINCAHASENAQSGSEEVSNFKKYLGLSEETNATEKIESYIDSYIDWPFVDSVRYREVSLALSKGSIPRDEAAAKFLDFLTKESTLHSRIDLERMADVMVKNCIRNTPITSNPVISARPQILGGALSSPHHHTNDGHGAPS